MNILPHIPGENWKEIPGYNYLISDHGRVYSLFRNHLLKPGLDKDGYFLVRLAKAGIGKSYRLHNLEMKIFKGLPEDPKMVVMHLDDNPQNNILTNLKYGTTKENISDSYNKGRHREAIALQERFGNKYQPTKRVYLLGRDGSREIYFNSPREVEKLLGIKRAAVISVCGSAMARKDGKPRRAGGFALSY